MEWVEEERLSLPDSAPAGGVDVEGGGLVLAASSRTADSLPTADALLVEATGAEFAAMVVAVTPLGAAAAAGVEAASTWWWK